VVLTNGVMVGNHVAQATGLGLRAAKNTGIGGNVFRANNSSGTQFCDGVEISTNVGSRTAAAPERKPRGRDRRDAWPLPSSVSHSGPMSDTGVQCADGDRPFGSPAPGARGRAGHSPDVVSVRPLDGLRSRHRLHRLLHAGRSLERADAQIVVRVPVLRARRDLCLAGYPGFRPGAQRSSRSTSWWIRASR